MSSSHARRRAPARLHQPATAAVPASVNPSADELAGKTGLYRLGPDENHIVSMSIRDGRFGVWDFYGDNYHLLMTPIGANRFTLSGVTLEFSPAEAGRPRAWHIVDGGGQRLMELPLVTFDVSKAYLGAFAGAYRSEELDVTYTVAKRESGLVLESSTLLPVSRDAFVGDYLWVRSGSSAIHEAASPGSRSTGRPRGACGSNAYSRATHASPYTQPAILQLPTPNSRFPTTPNSERPIRVIESWQLGIESAWESGVGNWALPARIDARVLLVSLCMSNAAGRV